MDHWLSAPFDVEMFAGCTWPLSRPRRSFGKTWAERGNGGVSPLMPRLGVTDWIRPLTRCTMCNGLLAQPKWSTASHRERCTISADSPSAQHAARSIGKELTMSGSHGLSEAR
jgi:hypothetical protein